jgi:hypothetical protein
MHTGRQHPARNGPQVILLERYALLTHRFKAQFRSF